MSVGVASVGARVIPCFDKKILVLRGKLPAKQGGMLKNSWIQLVFRPVFTVCDYADGVVLRLQPDSKIHELPSFLHQMWIFARIVLFGFSRLSFHFFLYLREKKKERRGEKP
jgi:hypothetical protein